MPLCVLKSADELQTRVGELGARITKDYKGKNLVLIGILKGAFVFLADLSRKIEKEVSVTIDFMRMSSCGDKKTSTGTTRILLDISQPIEGKDVIIVEDIIDTGQTMHFLLENLKTRLEEELAKINEDSENTELVSERKKEIEEILAGIKK